MTADLLDSIDFTAQLTDRLKKLDQLLREDRAALLAANASLGAAPVDAMIDAVHTVLHNLPAGVTSTRGVLPLDRPASTC